MSQTPLRVLTLVLASAVGAVGAFASFGPESKVPTRSRVVRVTDIQQTSHRTDGDRYFEVDRLDQAILQLEKEGWVLRQVSAIDADSALLLVDRGD